MIFNKIKINKNILDNRIFVSPMCQYSADAGTPSDWHYAHLAKLIKTGASMLIIESTAISAEGRISNKDLSIYTDRQKKYFKKLIEFLKKIEKKKLICLQISHSGRKGSAFIPWVRNNTSLPIKNGWKTCAPSAIKKDEGWPTPYELKSKDICKIIKDFKKAALFLKKTKIDAIEIHMAHGYLLHQFLSPISNKRKDVYGGTLQKRMKFPLEVAKEIRKIWPSNKILGARITGDDHLPGGITAKDCMHFAKKLEEIGFDYLCISSGGITTKTEMKQKKGFRLDLCAQIKKKLKIPIGTTGLLDDDKILNRALIDKKIDFAAIGRRFLSDPMWIYKICLKKNQDIVPKQYLRGFIK